MGRYTGGGGGGVDQAALDTHAADTTSVHGVTDTSTLYRAGGTDVAVADGGTGASTAAAARTNLGVATLTRVQGDGSGNHTTTSTTLTDVAAAYSLTVPAVAGDVLEIQFDCTMGNTGTNFNALAVNVSGTGDVGVQRLQNVDSNSWQGTARVFHVVQAGDITGGNVTVKPRWRVGAGTGTIYNETTNNRKPVFSVKNWKQ